MPLSFYVMLLYDQKAGIIETGFNAEPKYANKKVNQLYCGGIVNLKSRNRTGPISCYPLAF